MSVVRWLVRLVLLAALVALLASCEDRPPHLNLTVTTTVDGSDAVPGDAVCEMTPSVGDCSLRAAIDESNANAGHTAFVTIPSETYHLTQAGEDDTNVGGDLDLTPGSGTIVLFSDTAAAVVVDADGATGAIDVRNGHAVLAGISITGASADGLATRGAAELTYGFGTVHANAGTGIRLDAGSITHVLDATVSSNGAGVVGNGTAELLYTTVSANTGAGIAGTGTTTLAASVVADQGGPDCTAPVTSSGDNLDTDGTCGLAGPADRSATPAGLAALSADTVPVHRPLPGSALLDATPLGTRNCGAPDRPVVDQTNRARWVHGACDRGAVEVDFALDLTVDTAVDAVDAAPGDGTCAVAGGGCSLRAAITEADARPVTSGHHITLAADPVLTITGQQEDANLTGDLDVTTDVTIVGADHTIDAGHVDRVIDHRGGHLVVSDARITGGTLASPAASGDANGPGIRTGATVDLDHVTIDSNTTASGRGGALSVESGATATLTGSYVHGNHSGQASSIWVDFATATIRTTTVADERVEGNFSRMAVDDSTIDSSGEAVYGYAVRFDVRRSLLASHGAAIMTLAGQVDIRGSIIAPVGGPSCGTNAVGAPFVSHGYNASTDSSCSLTATGDQPVVNSLLGPLADHGGPAPTRLAAAGSPTLDAIPADTDDLCDAATATDQRGVARPAGPACDIGPAEGADPATIPLSLVVDTAADDPDTTPGDGVCATAAGACSLRAAVTETNARPTSDTVTITPGIDPLVAGAAADDANVSGDFDINGFLTIVGHGAALGAASDRTFDVHGRLELSDVALTGGQLSALDSANAGGSIRAVGDLVLDHVTISHGTAATGGGIAQSAGTLHLTATTVSGNAADNGAGVWASGSTVTIEDSTLSDNVAPLAIGGIWSSTAFDGGALHLTKSATTIVNSTLDHNAATHGAAIFRYDASPLHLLSTTLTGNEVGTLGGATIQDNYSSPPVTVTGSVISAGSGAACLSPITSEGWNVFGDSSCATAAPTDQVATNPLLGALTANGGPTPTKVPHSGSPLLDAIPVGTPGLCDGTHPTDQRGVARPGGTACDIGSVEGAGSAITPLALTVDTAVDGPDTDRGDGVCAMAVGGCSLRAAIDETNARVTSDTITIAPGVNPTLSVAGTGAGRENANASGDLDTVGYLTIFGGGATLDAAHLDRALELRGGSLTVHDLTITHGSVANRGLDSEFCGGGVLANGDLTLAGSALRDNQVPQFSFGSSGGGLCSNRGSVVRVTDSVIEQNRADQDAAYAGSNITVVRSTVDGGMGLAGGGHIIASTVVSAGDAITGRYRSSAPLTITSSTVRGGRALVGGGQPITITASTLVASSTAVSLPGYGPAPWVTTVSGSILSAPTGVACDRPVTSGGWNVAGDASCGLGGPSDQQALNPMLGALADNGGPTRTFLPPAASPGLDAIPVGTPGLCDGTLPTDQRGVARPGGAACDIGAVEGVGPALTPLSLTVTTATDLPDTTPGDGVCTVTGGGCSLRAAIDEANRVLTSNTITIAAGIDPVLALSGSDDTNAAGDLDVTGTLTIDGQGAVIDAAQIDRVFQQQGGLLSLRHLTVTGGRLNANGARGAAIYANGGSLDLLDVTVSGNSAIGTNAGGGGIATNGALHLTGSKILSNHADGYGGAIQLDTGYSTSHGVLTLVDSTVDGNTASNGAGLSLGPNSSTSISTSTISSNVGGLYGGVLTYGATLDITQSTISGNSGTNPGIAVVVDTVPAYAFPGSSGPTHIVASTIVRNNGGAGVVGLTTCGSPCVPPTVTVLGSIVSGFFADACGGTVVSVGWNLMSNATCGAPAVSDVLNLNVMVAAINNNGGPTFTNLPAALSPAVDSIPVGTPGLCDGTFPTDQRGQTRPNGAACDRGSVER